MPDPNTQTPAPADFDVAGALKAGYSEHEIASYLGSRTGFDVDGAQKAGYSANEIIQHLLPAPPERPQSPPPPAEAPSGTLKGMAKAAGQQAIESSAALKTGVGAFTKTIGQSEAHESAADVGLMRRLDQGDDFGTLMKAAPNDLARLALREYQVASPERKTKIRQDAINAAAAPPGAVERAGENIRQAGHELSATAKDTFPLTPEEQQRPTVIATKMVVGMLPYVGAALAGGMPAIVGVAGVDAFGTTYDEAKKAGSNDADAAGAALLSGMVQGGLMTVPIGQATKLLDTIPAALKGEFVKALAEAAKSGVTLTAFSQVSQIADNVIAQNTYDPARKPLEGVGENLGATFAAGAVLPVAGVALGRVARAVTPKVAADKVMAAPTVDAAIDAAQQAVAGTPVDVPAIAAGARDLGGVDDQRQAKLLQLFGGLNRGTVEQGTDGTYHYRTGEGDEEKTIPLKLWDPRTPAPEPAEGQAAAPTISPALAAAQRDHYEKLGIDVVYFENDKAIPFDGAVDPQNPNTIFLSNDPQRNAAQVGAHELTHVLESTRLPDGTSLGDVLHQQISEGITNEGWRHAVETFGKTAPERAAFPAGPEGDSAHADAVVSHLVRELGADIGGEAPRFQTFVPKVIDQVQARYGIDAAKDVLQKLMAGIRSAMQTMREFFFKPEEHAEYGQPETQSQHWVTNLDEIHDTLVKMYAVKFGTQAERENVGLAAMRDKAARDRFVEAPASEVPPPHAPEGFFDAGTPESITPEAQRPAIEEAHQRIVRMRRWLAELDEKRRADAEASPQATFLRQTEATILGKVNGVEDRLTKVAASRLATTRQALTDLLHPTGDNVDMAKVREALLGEQQRMADAAAVGSARAPMGGRSGGRPRASRQEPIRGQAVMPEERPVEPVQQSVEAEQPVAPPVAAEPAPSPAPVPASPLSEYEAKVQAERERVWNDTAVMGRVQRGIGRNEDFARKVARERVMREEAEPDIKWAVEEGGLPPDSIAEIAQMYRRENGQDPKIAFDTAVDRWITIEEAKGALAFGDADVATYDLLKSLPSDPVLDEMYARLEKHYAGSKEIPSDEDIPFGQEPARATEAPGAEAASAEAGRPEGDQAGREPAGGGGIPGEAPEGPALSPNDKAAFSPKGDEPALLETPPASAEVLAARQRAAEKEEAEARMRGRKVAGAPQESADDLPLFGGERQKTLFSPKQTETPEFERWFGDSKMVERDGQPSVFYHGTAADIERFQPEKGQFQNRGMYFTKDSLLADIYADSKAKKSDGGASVYPVYLKMENPKVIDNPLWQKVKAYFADRSPRRTEFSRDAEARPSMWLNDKEIANLKTQGFDGIVNKVWNEVVVFDPEQIKSAIGNRGTFDASNPDIRMSPKITGETKARTYTPEERAAYERLGRAEESVPLAERWAQFKQNLGTRIIRATLDPYVGVKKADPLGYMALRNFNTTAGALEYLLTQGTLKFEGLAYNEHVHNGGVEGMVIKPLRGEHDDWAWWVAAHRAERLSAEDREHLFTPDEIATLKKTNRGELPFDYQLPNGKTTRSREAAYADTLRKYDVFQKNVMDLGVEAGLFSREKVDALWSNPFYVPFYRQAEDSAHFVGASNSNNFVKQTAFKALKGGTEKLHNDLWENIIGNWGHIIDAAGKNVAANRVLDTAELPANGAARKITAKEHDHEMAKSDKDDTTWTMIDGKQQYWHITDPMLFDAIGALNTLGFRDPVSKAANWFSRVLRMGVTSDPRFMLRITIKDSEQAVATAPMSYNIAKNVVEGYRMTDLPGAMKNVARAVAGQEMEGLNEAAELRQALAGGGLMRLGAGHASGMRTTTAESMSGEAVTASDGVAYLARVFRAYKTMMAQSEDINRAALYKTMRDQGSPHDEATFAARDLEDFTLKGTAAVVRWLAQNVTFMNAGAQGLYKVGRSAADSDRNVTAAVGGKVAWAATSRVAKVLAATTLATLALDYIYKDDEDYKKRSEYDRNSKFWFKFGDYQIQIPMGFEIAALSRIAANGLDMFFDKEMTGDRFRQNALSIVGQNMFMDPIPTALSGVLDVATNTGATGHPIEPKGMENLRPEERYTINNTLASRGLSTAGNATARAIGGPNAEFLSPIQLDYLWGAYTGWLGSFVLGAADRTARSFTSEPARPEMEMWNFATGGMISKGPTPQSRYVDTMYRQADAVEKAYGTYMDLIHRQQIGEAQQFFADNKDLIQKHGIVSGVMRLEGNLNKQVRMITNNPDPAVTPEMKRIQIMQIQAVKNRAAEQAFGAH